MCSAKKIFFIIFIGIIAIGLSAASFVLAETQTGGITVGVTISGVCGDSVIDTGEQCDGANLNGKVCTTVGGSFTGGTLSCLASCAFNTSACTVSPPPSCTGDCAAPVISNVATTLITTSSARASWSASDDGTITAVSFVYGPSTAYGSNGTVVGTYSVDLSALSAATVYYFKISVSDGGGHTTESAGSFTTSPLIIPDTTAPVISNIQVTSGTTAVVVSFDTDEPTTAQISYGQSIVYASSTTFDGVLATTHSLTIPGLFPNTTYHFQIIASDVVNNTATSPDQVFTTLLPSPPVDVGSFSSLPAFQTITLNWNSTGINYFAGVRLLRKNNTTAPATAPDEAGAAVLLDNSGASEYVDSAVLPNVPYSYTIYVFDIFNQHSNGVSLNEKISVVGPEVCGNTVDDDNNNLTDCADPACSSDVSCLQPVENCFNGVDDDSDGATDCFDSDCLGVCAPLAGEDCANGIDDDSDGAIDCADSDCGGLASCGTDVIGAVGETCDNLFDDDSDGAIDCADSDCGGFALCAVSLVPACSDESDNDGDGAIDFGSDAGCESPDDTDESNGTVPGFLQLAVEDLKFIAGNRRIILVPDENRQISVLANAGFTVAVAQANLAAVPENISLIIDGATYQFKFNPADEIYYSDFILPAVGKHGAYLSVDYGLEQRDSLLIEINSLPFGLIESASEPAAGVELTLRDESGLVFDAAGFGQKNPQISGAAGLYGWVVPNGRYKIVANKDGYYERVMEIYATDNNTINKNINLIKLPTNLVEQVRAAGQLAAQAISDIADNPNVEQAAEQVAAPAAVGVTAVGTAILIPWWDLVALLRFLFLQPLLLVGRGKRKQWGTVYNSLSKMPIDLALVRLFDATTGKLVRSRVTDSAGRYAFIVGPGKYRLAVVKMNLLFPSVLLAKAKSDGNRPDIYHGEEINVASDGVLLTANIPLDPVGETKTPKRILRERFWRKFQSLVSGLGLLFTLAALYVSPVWYMWILAAAHFGLIFLFRRLAKPKTAKGWGIVYDENTHKPIGRAVARLFDTRFNRLVATEITDKHGRYNFLAGDNKYYVAYEHNDYEPGKTDVIDLTGKEEDAIAADAKLRKKT